MLLCGAGALLSPANRTVSASSTEWVPFRHHEMVEDRVRCLNQALFRSGAKYVLYWSQMNRRVSWNHALLYAAELANRARLPLLVYEGLTCSYPYASGRLHTFILEGVPDTEQHLRRLGIGYVFHLRRKWSAPDDILYRLTPDAAALVTDDYPTFIARRHNAGVPSKLSIPYYAVDSSCIVPMSRMEKREYAAYTIRPKIRKLLAQYLTTAPPLRVRQEFNHPLPDFRTNVTSANIAELVASSEIDHSVRPVPAFRGGSVEAQRRLKKFLRKNLSRYSSFHNQPNAQATSLLSAYLHFGHLSSLDVALAVQNYAQAHKLMADEFLEELIVRRELAFNFARFSDNVESFDNLPRWAQATLKKHARNKRDPVYSPDQFKQARTHDRLWNAAQKELLGRGRIHGYYRMYWGKKIIEWSRTPEQALKTMIYLNDRYALDGRDPNGYANILWCFGLHDRPWVERPIFGQVRYMSYQGMRRKTDVDGYIRGIECEGERE
jgi:deoxyribodipyrimidine photo-lyase